MVPAVVVDKTNGAYNLYSHIPTSYYPEYFEHNLDNGKPFLISMDEVIRRAGDTLGD